MCLCMHDFQETIFNAVPNSNLSNSSLSLIFELHTRCTGRGRRRGEIDIVFSLNILLCLPYICTILFSKRNFHGGRMIGCYIMFIKNFKFTMILKLFIRPENYVVIFNHV